MRNGLRKAYAGAVNVKVGFSVPTVSASSSCRVSSTATVDYGRRETTFFLPINAPKTLLCRVSAPLLVARDQPARILRIPAPRCQSPCTSGALVRTIRWSQRTGLRRLRFSSGGTPNQPSQRPSRITCPTEMRFGLEISLIEASRRQLVEKRSAMPESVSPRRTV